ncbi:golgin subfamily B member 1-like isoform X2 [Limulus polyphemus]|uniref:Golgin subfamily B member 1-like isoform X2 n=1 Tax=Limulus polyphemus TaxID=6850 RepID=A0ABM1TN39_LIMPO|nr:golgin subfamily B member 1-like isoform X2 [Limulus polyphemus]
MESWSDRTLPLDLEQSANPEQLHEFTMDSVNQSEVFSPTASQRGAILSPVRARTMKEYDQHIADLRKENFNLKLKLYFLEEKMEKKYDGDSKELHRINIKLQVDVETLHKELEQKHKLLQDALGTLEKLEQSHRREIEELKERNSEEKCHLEGKLIVLEKELQLEKQFRVKENDQNNEAYKQAFGLETSQASHAINVPNKEDNSEQNKLNKLVKDLKDVICKKEEEIEVTRQRLSKEEEKIKILEVKTQKRDKTIQGLIQTVNKKDKEIQQLNKIVADRHEAIDSIDGAFSTALYKATVAASKGAKNDIVVAREELKTTLKEVLFSNSKEAGTASGSASFSKEDLLEEVQRLRIELQMKDDNIKILGQQSTGRLQQVENLQHSLKLLQEEMSKSAHLHSKICSEKDAMIVQLQHSIQDTQKTMEDVFMGNDKASLEQECNALHQAIKEKDNFIQELLSERNKTAKEMEKSLQGLLNNLRLKDSTVQELEKKLKEDLQCKDEEIQRLNKELSSSNETLRTEKEEKEALNLQIVQLREAQNYIETDLKNKNEKLNELTIKTEELTEQLKNAEQQKSQIEQFFKEKEQHLHQANINLNEVNAELESKKLMLDHTESEVQLKTKESKSLQNDLNLLQSVLSETEHNLSVRNEELSSAYETIEKLKLDLEEAQKNVGLIFEVGCLTEQLREAEEEKHNLVKERDEKDVRLEQMVNELDNTRHQLHEKEVELVEIMQHLDGKSNELTILETDLQFLQDCLAKENDLNATANKKIKELSKELEIIKAEMEKRVEDKEQVITDLQMKLNDIQLDASQKLSQENRVHKIDMASQTNEDSYQQLEEMRKEVRLREKAILQKDDFICKLHSALNTKNEELNSAKNENKSLSDQLMSIKQELVTQKKETEDLNKRIVESIQERADQESLDKPALDFQNQTEEMKVLLDELQQSKQKQKTLQDQVKILEEELSQIKANKSQDRAKSNEIQKISPSADLMSTIDNLRSQLDESKLRNESLLSQLSSVVVHMASIVKRQSLISPQESHEGKLSDKENEREVYRLQRMMNNLEKFLKNERKFHTNICDEDSHEIERTSIPRAQSEPLRKEEKGIQTKDRCLRSTTPPFSSTQLQTLTDIHCLEHDQVYRLKDLLSKAQQEIQVLHAQNENNETVARKQTALANYYRTQLQEAGCFRLPENLLLSKSDGDVTSGKEHRDIDVTSSMSKTNQLLMVNSVSQPNVDNLSHGKKHILETVNKSMISPNVRHSLPACLDGGRKSGGSPLWKQLQSHNLSHFGHSDDVCQLKEEVCVLVLRIEQLEKQAQNSLGNVDNTVMHHDEMDKLQNQLFYSQRVCELLQSRLEELADFLEKLLVYDGNGHLNSSILTPECVDRVRQFLTESKELSRTLSHSLIVSGSSSVFEGDSTLYSSVHHDIREQPTVSSHLGDLKLNRNSILDHSDLMKDKTSQRDNDQMDEIATELHRLKVQVADLEFEKQQLKLQVKNLQNEESETSEGRDIDSTAIYSADEVLSSVSSFHQNHSLRNDMLTHSRYHLVSDTFTDGVRKEGQSWEQAGQVVVLEASDSDDILLLLNDCGLPLHNSLEKDEAAVNPTTHSLPQQQGERLNFSQRNLAVVMKGEPEISRSKHVIFGNQQLSGIVNAHCVSCPSSDSDIWSEPDRNVSLQRMGMTSDNSNLYGLVAYQKYPRKQCSGEDWHSGDSSNSAKETEKLAVSSARKARKQKLHPDFHRIEMRLQNVEKLNGTLQNELRSHQEVIGKMLGKISDITPSGEKSSPMTAVPRGLIEDHLHSLKVLQEKLERAIISNEQLTETLRGRLEVEQELEEKNQAYSKLLEAKNQLEKEVSMKGHLHQEVHTRLQNLMEDVSDLRARLFEKDQQNKRAQDTMVAMEKDREAKQKQCKEVQDWNFRLQKEIEEKENICKSLQKKIEDFMEQNATLENLVQQSDRRLTEIYEKYLKNNRSEEECTKLENEISKKQREVSELFRANENLRNQFIVKEKQVDTLENDKSLLNLEVSKLNDKCIISDQTVSQLKEELSNTKEKLAKIEKDCSEMKEKIHQSQTNENNFVTKVSETEQQLLKAQYQVTELQNKHEWLEDQLHTKEEKLEQFSNKISWLENQIDQKQKELELSADKCVRLQREFHEHNQQYEVEKTDFEKQLKEKQEEIKELKYELKLREEEHTKFQELEIKWAELVRENKRLQNRIANLEDKLQEKYDIHDERELKFNALEKQVTELAKMNENLNNQLIVKEKQVNSLEQDKSMLSLEVSKFKEKYSTTDQMISQLKEELLSTMTKLAKMRKACSEMEEKIHQSQTSENRFVTKASETERQLLQAQYQVTDLQNKHEWLEDQLHRKDQKLQQFSDKVSWLEQQINLKQKELETSGDRCLKLQQECHENNQQYEIAKHNFEQQLRDKGQVIEELMEKVTCLKQQVKERDQEHGKLQDWNMKIQETIQEKEVKWIEELSEKNRLQNRVDALEEEIKHLKEEESSKIDNGKEHSGYRFSEFFKEKSRLEEELNATQQRLREVTQLNKSLQVELKVMDKLGIQKDDHTIVEAQAEQLEETSKTLLLELVGELRQLRSALAKSTQVNSKLHRRIKQYSSKKEGTNSKLHSENTVSPVSSLSLASSGNFPIANIQPGDLGKSSPSESVYSLRGVPSYLHHSEVQHDSVNLTQSTCKNEIEDNKFIAMKQKSTRNVSRASSLPNGHINTEVNSSDGSIHRSVFRHVPQQLSSGSADTETPLDTVLSSDAIQPHLIDQNKRISSDRSSRQSSGEKEGFRHGSNGTETPASGRPCYSSPDLGIESDPNREGGDLAIREGQETTTWNQLADPKWSVSSSHSALDSVGINNKTNGSLSRLHKTFAGEQLPQDMIGLTGRDFSVSTPELCDAMLHAVCWLKDYELLKKEIGESLVLLRGVEARVKNRLNSISVRNTSADKSLEYSTMKEINTNCVYLGGCLEKSWDIIACFWVTSVPLKKAVSSTSLSPLIIENQKLRDELFEVRNQLSSQHKQLEEAMHKLSSVKFRKEGMEKAITKQLTKTRRVLQQAKGNLADGKKQEKPTKRPVAVVRYSKGESENLPENRSRV